MRLLLALVLQLLVITVPIVAEAAKPGVVLLPIQGEGLSRADRDDYRGALAQALAGKYEVYSGDDVDKKLEKFAKKTCKDAKCLQEMATAYQAGLIGRGVISKKGGGYLIRVELRDASSGKVAFSETQSCARCGMPDVIAALKALGGQSGAVASPGTAASLARARSGEDEVFLGPAVEKEAATFPKDFKDCAECPEMVVVPAGSFEMGSNDGESTEQPVHRVTIPAFAIGKTEVTQAQWAAVMGTNPSRGEACDTCPVDRVSWDDVQGFLQKLNAKTGKRYRLPSEAEWEYACRAGAKTPYCGSEEIEPVAWYVMNSRSESHPVAQKQANAFGLHDMSGNAWEWTADCWNKSYAGAPTDGSAWTTGDCEWLVVRGGSWDDASQDARSARRETFNSTLRSVGLGFRVALSPARTH